jgi:hypothetical protein
MFQGVQSSGASFGVKYFYLGCAGCLQGALSGWRLAAARITGQAYNPEAWRKYQQ